MEDFFIQWLASIQSWVSVYILYYLIRVKAETIYIFYFLLIVFLFLEYFKDELTGNSILTTLIIMAITLLFVVFSNKKQSKFYSAFWVESLPVLWLTLLLVFS